LASGNQDHNDLVVLAVAPMLL